MKVEAQEAPAGPEKPAPDKDRFRQVLQETGARPPTQPPRPGGTPGASRPGALPGRSAPRPGGEGGAGGTKPGATLSRPSGPAVARAAGRVLATARSALASPENLGHARQVMNTEAHRLGTVRGEAHLRQQEHTEHRVSELLARELARDDRAVPMPPPASRPASPESSRAAPPPEPDSMNGSEPRVGATGGAGPAGPPDAPAPPSRAEATLALIEKIEVFVKSQRPALRLSLRGALEATVEVERTGPREVALRIQGKHGPVPAEDLSRMRDALEARGLRLRSLRSE